MADKPTGFAAIAATLGQPNTTSAGPASRAATPSSFSGAPVWSKQPSGRNTPNVFAGRSTPSTADFGTAQSKQPHSRTPSFSAPVPSRHAVHDARPDVRGASEVVRFLRDEDAQLDDRLEVTIVRPNGGYTTHLLRVSESTELECRFAHAALDVKPVCLPTCDWSIVHVKLYRGGRGNARTFGVAPPRDGSDADAAARSDASGVSIHDLDAKLQQVEDVLGGDREATAALAQRLSNLEADVQEATLRSGDARRKFVADADAKNEELRRALAESRAQVAKQDDHLRSLRDEVATLSGKFRDECEKRGGQYDSLQRCLDDERAKRKSITEEVQRLRSAATSGSAGGDAKNLLADTDAQLRRLTKDFAGLRSAVDGVEQQQKRQAQQRDVAERFDRVDTEVAKVGRHADRLNAEAVERLEGLAETTARLAERLSHVEQRPAATGVSRTKLDERVEDLRQRVLALEARAPPQSPGDVSPSRASREIQSDTRERADQAYTLAQSALNEAAEHGDFISNLRTVTGNLRAELDSLTRDANDRARTQRSQIADLADDLKGVERATAEVQRKCDELGRDAPEALRNSVHARREASESAAQLKELRSRSDTEEDAIRAAFRQVQDQIEQLNARPSHADPRLSMAGDGIDDLEQRLSAAESHKDDVDLAFDAIQQELATLRDSIAQQETRWSATAAARASRALASDDDAAAVANPRSRPITVRTGTVEYYPGEHSGGNLDAVNPLHLATIESARERAIFTRDFAKPFQLSAAEKANFKESSHLKFYEARVKATAVLMQEHEHTHRPIPSWVIGAVKPKVGKGIDVSNGGVLREFIPDAESKAEADIHLTDAVRWETILRNYTFLCAVHAAAKGATEWTKINVATHHLTQADTACANTTSQIVKDNAHVIKLYITPAKPDPESTPAAAAAAPASSASTKQPARPAAKQPGQQGAPPPPPRVSAKSLAAAATSASAATVPPPRTTGGAASTRANSPGRQSTSSVKAYADRLRASSTVPADVEVVGKESGVVV
ncbi:MAG: hypothetical protein Q9Q40_03655 [Acidobacteriota bacterium]|nr:hypothetical protein [Acidobacteriota bacterium]